MLTRMSFGGCSYECFKFEFPAACRNEVDLPAAGRDPVSAGPRDTFKLEANGLLPKSSGMFL
jgi:hypothetical protein